MQIETKPDKCGVKTISIIVNKAEIERFVLRMLLEFYGKSDTFSE